MDGLTSNYYVYVYIDPRNFEEFYYGKGKGSRKDAHLTDVTDSAKVRRIKAIESEGLSPIIKVVAKDLTEEQAFLVEKTLIWRLGRNLTNISSGNFANKFRAHDSVHKDLMGFDYENDAYYVNVGEGEHRSWEDCMRYGFLSAGQHPKWSTPIRSLKRGDVVVAYLKNHGYVGVGKVLGSAVIPSQFSYNGVPLSKLELAQPNIFVNDGTVDSEYLVPVRWTRAFERNQAKWERKSKLFTTALIKASLQKQLKTQRFLEVQFEFSFEDLLSDNDSSDS
jgi:hypothetical protein